MRQESTIKRNLKQVGQSRNSRQGDAELVLPNGLTTKPSDFLFAIHLNAELGLESRHFQFHLETQELLAQIERPGKLTFLDLSEAEHMLPGNFHGDRDLGLTINFEIPHGVAFACHLKFFVELVMQLVSGLWISFPDLIDLVTLLLHDLFSCGEIHLVSLDSIVRVADTHIDSTSEDGIDPTVSR
ncbi:hypothetical protein D7X30_10430 [Corallococcus sp. AB011P]|nr:hypothetical protein D7X30_10430 [Corallococcus sp. AB011P]